MLLGAVEGGYSFEEVEHRFVDLSEVGLVHTAQIYPPDLLQFVEEEIDRGLEGGDYRDRVAELQGVGDCLLLEVPVLDLVENVHDVLGKEEEVGPGQGQAGTSAVGHPMRFLDFVVESMNRVDHFGVVVDPSQKHNVVLAAGNDLKLGVEVDEVAQLFLVFIDGVEEGSAGDEEPALAILAVILGGEEFEDLEVFMEDGVLEMVDLTYFNYVSELTQHQNTFVTHWLHVQQTGIEHGGLFDLELVGSWCVEVLVQEEHFDVQIVEDAELALAEEQHLCYLVLAWGLVVNLLAGPVFPPPPQLPPRVTGQEAPFWADSEGHDGLFGLVLFGVDLVGVLLLGEEGYFRAADGDESGVLVVDLPEGDA